MTDNGKNSRKQTENNTASALIKALFKRVRFLYHVSLNTGEFTEYIPVCSEEILKEKQKGTNFFETIHMNMKEITPSDKTGFTREFTKENIRNSLERYGEYVLYCQMTEDGNPFMLKIRAVPMPGETDQIIVTFLHTAFEAEQHALLSAVNRDTASDIGLQTEKEYRRILQVAYKDALTGVRNRAAYLEAEEELNHHITAGNPEPFAIALFDVNDLKAVNDQSGHLAGDEYLKNACRIICRLFKHSPVFRIGGDEFTAIVKGEDLLNAEKLLKQLEEINCRNADTGDVVTAYSLVRYENEKDMAELFRRADEQLYAEKKRLKQRSGK